MDAHVVESIDEKASYSFEKRQCEKQASREIDDLELKSGQKSRNQLREENGLVKILSIDWDLVRAPKR